MPFKKTSTCHSEGCDIVGGGGCVCGSGGGGDGGGGGWTRE